MPITNGKVYYNKSLEVPVGTNPNSSYPVINILNDKVNDKFKTTTITENTITWNYSSAPNIKSITILNHSQPDTTFKIEASNDNFVSTLVSLDLSILTENSFLTLDWSIYDDIRLRFEDSVNVFEAGVVFLALSEYVFLRNYNVNFPGGESQTFSRNISRATGSIFKKQQFKKYKQNTFFNFIVESQYLAFIDISWNSLFVVYFPTGIDNDFYFGDMSFPGIPVNVGRISELKNVNMTFEEQT